MAQPQRTREHVLADEGVGEFQRIFRQWVVHEVGRNDYGVDAEVQIFASDGSATGLFFKAQIKGTDSTDSPTLRVRVAKSTQRYWRSLGVPVLVFLYASATDTCYARWAHSYDSFNEGNDEIDTPETVSLSFKQESRIDRSSLDRVANEVAILRKLKERGHVDRIPIEVDLENLPLGRLDKSETEHLLRRTLRDLPCGFRPVRHGSQVGFATLALNDRELRMAMPADSASVTLHHTYSLARSAERKALAEEIAVASAVLFAKLGLDSEAVDLYEQAPECALSVEPLTISALFDSYLALRRPDEAFRLMGPLLLAGERPIESLQMLGAIASGVYGTLSRISQLVSLEVLDKTIASYTEGSPVLAARFAVMKGLVFQLLEDFEGAIRAFRHAARLHPDIVSEQEYLRSAAVAFERLGRWDAAEACFRDCIENGDESDEVKVAHVNALLHVGLYREAGEASVTYEVEGEKPRMLLLLLQEICAFALDDLAVARQPRHQLSPAQLQSLSIYGDHLSYLRVLASTDCLDHNAIRVVLLRLREGSPNGLPIATFIRMLLIVAWELQDTHHWLTLLEALVRFDASDAARDATVESLLTAAESEEVDALIESLEDSANEVDLAVRAAIIEGRGSGF